MPSPIGLEFVEEKVQLNVFQELKIKLQELKTKGICEMLYILFSNICNARKIYQAQKQKILEKQEEVNIKNAHKRQELMMQAAIMIQKMKVKVNKNSYVYYNEFMKKLFDFYYMPILEGNLTINQLVILNQSNLQCNKQIQKKKISVVDKEVRRMQK